VNATSHEGTYGRTAALPAPLLAFAERNVGRVHGVIDGFGPRENCRVWRLTAGQLRGTWYLKQHTGVKLHAREVRP
jgi:hypothetical protein